MTTFSKDPFFDAIEKNNIDIVQSYIALKHDVNATDQYGNYPLHTAFKYGKTIAVDDNEKASEIIIAEFMSKLKINLAQTKIIIAEIVTWDKPSKTKASFIFFSFSKGISKPILNINKTIPNSAMKSKVCKSFSPLKLKIKLIIVPVTM